MTESPRVQWSPGQDVSHYRLIRLMARGGMGELWEAVDRDLDRPVVIKFLRPELAADAERLERFEREAKAIAALNHPNIVTIYSVESVGSHRFLTMELVEGETLRRYLRQEGCSLKEILGIALPLSEALSVAHESGITHRDFKPENVMVTRSGRVKVLDFGLAKLAADHLAVAPELESRVDTVTAAPAAPQQLTGEGRVMGTVPYMSPEQVRGQQLDPRTDIFSLGVVLYEALTGRRPFRGDSDVDVMSSIIRDRPESLAVVRGDIPRRLSSLVELCLEKDPRHRIQSALDLHNQLRQLHRDLQTESTGSGPRQIVGRATRRQRFPSLKLVTINRMMRGRSGPTLLLALVFFLNWMETSIEGHLRNQFQIGAKTGRSLAEAAHWLEGRYVFYGHDTTSPIAVYGYSLAYFFVFAAMFVGVAVAFAGRSQTGPYRVLSLAVAINYAISLPFFMFFPVPERWSYADSGAVLLSDLWSTSLIESIRPMSGLDNCFPSFHVSLTVALILLSYLFRFRMRGTVMVLGLSVILSTYVLGIHWLTDIGAGLAVGVLSVALALRVGERFEGATSASPPDLSQALHHWDEWSVAKP